MKRIRVHGGRVVDPASGLDATADIFIADKQFVGIGEPPAGFTPELSIDASGLVVCPGLVDLATHLREPGEEHKATIASEVTAAARGGITCLCPSPATNPVTDATAVVELVTRRARQAHMTRVMPLGALTVGLKGQFLSEMAELKAAGCVAVSDGGRPVPGSLVLRRALEYAATHDLTVFLTPQDPDLTNGGWMHEGHVATRMGVPGIAVAAETAALARYLALIEETGARAHFARLSSARGVGMLARARQDGLPVSADVAMHQLFLSEMDLSGFNAQCHLLPPLRSDADREALRAAVAAGTITAICSDHQPHDADAKAATLVASECGASGVDSLLALLLRLVDDGLMDLATALARVTCDAADVLGVPRGRILTGRPADLCLFDPDEPWWLTPETMASQGHNSPFLGWEFAGRVRWTLLEGRVINERVAEA